MGVVLGRGEVVGTGGEGVMPVFYGWGEKREDYVVKVYACRQVGRRGVGA